MTGWLKWWSDVAKQLSLRKIDTFPPEPAKSCCCAFHMTQRGAHRAVVQIRSRIYSEILVFTIRTTRFAFYSGHKARNANKFYEPRLRNQRADLDFRIAKPLSASRLMLDWSSKMIEFDVCPFVSVFQSSSERSTDNRAFVCFSLHNFTLNGSKFSLASHQLMPPWSVSDKEFNW